MHFAPRGRRKRREKNTEDIWVNVVLWDAAAGEQVGRRTSIQDAGNGALAALRVEFSFSPKLSKQVSLNIYIYLRKTKYFRRHRSDRLAGTRAPDKTPRHESYTPRVRRIPRRCHFLDGRPHTHENSDSMT